jgi:hypothetical protein
MPPAWFMLDSGSVAVHSRHPRTSGTYVWFGLGLLALGWSLFGRPNLSVALVLAV